MISHQYVSQKMIYDDDNDVLARTYFRCRRPHSSSSCHVVVVVVAHTTTYDDDEEDDDDDGLGLPSLRQPLFATAVVLRSVVVQ